MADIISTQWIFETSDRLLVQQRKAPSVVLRRLKRDQNSEIEIEFKKWGDMVLETSDEIESLIVLLQKVKEKLVKIEKQNTNK